MMQTMPWFKAVAAGLCLIGGVAQAQAPAQSPGQRYAHDVSCAANTSALVQLNRQQTAPTGDEQARWQKMVTQVSAIAAKSGAAIGKSEHQVSIEIGTMRDQLIAKIPSDPVAAKDRKGEIGMTAMSCAFAALENEMGKTK